MVKSKLIIYNSINELTELDGGVKTIKYNDLIKIIKNLEVIKHFFRYNEVEFRVKNDEVIQRPLINIILMRLLSKGKCYFKFYNGDKMHVSLLLCIKGMRQFVIDFIQKENVIKKVLSDINGLEDKYKVNLGKQKKLNFSLQPLYFRTDLIFELASGGSIGHIAGVLNNLENYTGQPIFFSSDDIPTVNSCIHRTIIYPQRKFKDYKEILPIYYNNTFERKVVNTVGDKEISFIYQRYSVYNYCGLKLSLNHCIPFVLEYNGSEIWISKNWGGKPFKYEKLAEKIEMLNLRGADLIVVVSEPMKEELVGRGIEPEKILVNPNGVNTDMYSPDIDGSSIRRKYDLDNKIVVGFIGSFGRWHGAEVLAEAFGKLLKENPGYKDKVRLLMIGDGMTMDQVKANLELYDVYGESILTGTIPQQDGPSYLAACDILASPHVPNPDGSRFFGSPTKLFEYMAMGKGIVASDLEQIGEILKHNVTAYMVKPGDAESLKEGLKELVENEDLRIRLGKAARDEVVRKYTWKQHTSNIIGALKEVCK